MTEEEWLASNDPDAMLTWLRGKVSDRKLRLFGCAVARQLPPRDEPDQSRRNEVIELAEAFAEGGAVVRKLRKAERERWVVASLDAFEVARGIEDEMLTDRQPALAALLRCVAGNPHRPVALEPQCLTADILAMAGPAYEERVSVRGELDVERLAVLADALEEAGCATAVVEHLRSPGPHVRGCWALDLVRSVD